MNARSDFRDLQVNGDSLVVIAREENDFYRALEIPYREYILTYVFNDNGKIVKQHLVPIAHKGMSTAEAMDGFLKWVRDTHPDRLNEIFRNGAVVFTAQSAEAYKELFAEWRAAGGGPSADKEK